MLLLLGMVVGQFRARDEGFCQTRGFVVEVLLGGDCGFGLWRFGFGLLTVVMVWFLL